MGQRGDRDRTGRLGNGEHRVVPADRPQQGFFAAQQRRQVRQGHPERLPPAPVMSRYHDVMTGKQTTVRLPEELAEQAEAIARVRGTSMNTVIVDALAAEVERV